MPSELLDILDENGSPTGEAKPRDEVHKLGLYHALARTFIFRRSGQEIYFLVQHRSPDKDANPDKWDVRHGEHVKHGETLDAAAVGGIKDELGLDVGPDDFIKGGVSKRFGGHKVFVNDYYLPWNGDITSLKFNDGEVQEVKWMQAKDILDDMKANPGIWAGDPESTEQILNSLTQRFS